MLKVTFKFMENPLSSFLSYEAVNMFGDFILIQTLISVLESKRWLSGLRVLFVTRLARDYERKDENICLIVIKDKL